MWVLLSAVAGIGLVLFWKGPNAVWGAITIGIVGGLVAAVITGFQWATVGKWIIVCVLVGIVVELVWRLFGNKNFKRK